MKDIKTVAAVVIGLTNLNYYVIKLDTIYYIPTYITKV